MAIGGFGVGVGFFWVWLVFVFGLVVVPFTLSHPTLSVGPMLVKARIGPLGNKALLQGSKLRNITSDTEEKNMPSRRIDAIRRG